MLAFVLEAALRSLLMALAVWGAIRVLRVQAVVAQKVAWVLVLLSAAAMPLVMRAPWLALDKALAIPRVPVEKIPGVPWLASHSVLSAGERPQSRSVTVQTAQVQIGQHPALSKPSPSHRISEDLASRPTVEFMQDSSRDSSQDASGDLPDSITALSTTPTKAAASAAIVSAIKTVRPKGETSLRVWNWQTIRALGFALYFGGVALLLVRMSIGLGMALRIWNRAQPVASMSWLDAEFSSVRVSRDVNSPVTIGSTVILPADYTEWDEDKLRVVLAHEQSHVRQGDFYLQLAAALYAAAFWFSPLGWWLQRKISELGEALSDCAGLEQAKDPASYAQILLEFAALPRTSPFTGALTGVAMARSSNVSGRIERILNDRRFRVAFLGGRRHAVLTAALVPVVMVATVACIRIVPSVEAAQAEKQVAATVKVAQPAPEALATVEPIQSVATSQDAAPQAPQSAPSALPAPAAQPAPAAPDVAAPAPEAIAPEPPEVPEVRDDSQDESHHFSYSHSDSRGGIESFAIVHGNHNSINMSSDDNEDLAAAKAKYHDNFIWFRRNGKGYVITDPALMAQAETMFRTDPRIQVRQKELQARMQALQDEMHLVRPETLKIDLNTPEFKHQLEELQLRVKDLDKIKIDVNTPEFKAQMEKMQLDLKRLNDTKVDLNLQEIQSQMGKLQGDLGRIDAIKIKAMTDKIDAEVQTQIDTEVKAEVTANLQEQLGDLQGEIGEVQGQIGEIQGLIGDQQGRLGERQGRIGERMGKIGEEMGKLGEQQGKQAEAAARRMQSVLDQAVKDGKAKPIE